MSNTIIEKKYKPNIAIDMVSAAKRHYENYGKKVESIKLSPRMFSIFKDGIRERNEEIQIEDAIQFNNLLVEKGSIFMTKSLIVKLKENG